MGRKLSTFVHVDGVAYGPESDVPDEVAEKITAPDVWADSTPVADKAADVTAEKPARRPAAAKD